MIETIAAPVTQTATRRQPANDIGTNMTIERIGPTEAERYLESSSANRPPRQGKIGQYARDMTAGTWHSSVIRFDREGKLVDGQHRLWAVIVSGSEQLFYVERGLPDEAIKTLDSGLVRTGGDVLAIRGEPNATNLAGAIRLARWFTLFPGYAPSSQSAQPFSPEELVDFLEINPDIRDAVRTGKQLTKSIPFSGSLAGALIYLERLRNPDKANSFWDQMATGARMLENTGPYLLRRTIIADRLRPREERLGTNHIAAISIKAYNYWEQDRPIKVLRWQRGPQFNESFPRLGVIVAD